jgi:hypothetical protein
MKYLEKNSSYKDKKKNVGARVSEVVLSALNNAEQDSNDLGYTFSITRIIDKALQDTLVELVEETGIDYLVLEQFKFEMNERQDIRNINLEDSNWIDFEKKAYEIKLRALNDSSVDMNSLIKEEEENTAVYWDKYVIHRKEKKVNTELEEVKTRNKHLKNELDNLHYENHMQNIERINAHNMGYGDIYEKALAEADNAFDQTMKNYEPQIEEAKGQSLYPGKTKAEIKVIEDRISKLTVDDLQPLSPMPNTD